MRWDLGANGTAQHEEDICLSRERGVVEKAVKKNFLEGKGEKSE